MAPNSSPIDNASMGALKPPPGVIPHFNDPGKQQIPYKAFAIIAIMLPTVFVGLRLWTKLRISKDMGWDDYTIVNPAITYARQLALWVRLTSMGCDSGTALEIAEASSTMYGPITALTRISLLLQFLRIFVPMRTPRKLFYFVQCLIWFNILFYTGDLFALIFRCSPQEKIWKPTVPGHCINKYVTYLRAAVANVITDIFIAVLPVKIIWGLQMPIRRKISVTAVFATGLLACICAIIRLIEAILWLHTEDFTYRIAAESYFIGAEVILGLICGCLPVLPRFFFHYYPKLASMLCYNPAFTKRPHPSTIRSHSTYASKPKTWGRGKSFEVPGGDGSYRELDDFRGQQRVQGRSVIIEGGLNHSASTQEGWSPDTDSFVDLTIATPSTAIRKTVRVESVMEA
ncbi:hypothetical protein JMJ35_009203 [Cladonia borealis]|uniref:Rhodopsin domain-containing protein n=1 Tax=Cladonia borealis TaxID=184061 RepID=A0AA39QTJ2_9LECA|nr:hypothetical protein JMJ35_009203 [Cladonia borealis]